MRAEGDGTASRRWHPRLSGELIIALCVIALAAIVYWQTLQIPVSPIYAQVGPTIVPTMCALGLGVLGVALLESVDEIHVIADGTVGAILLADGLAADHAHLGEEVFDQIH